MELFPYKSAVFLLLFALPLFFDLLSFNCKALGQCLQAESSALLQLKQGFTSAELETWLPGTDCCIWEGVTCGESTQVTDLDLSNRSIAGTINRSLFNLTTLRTLNFAYNQFGGMCFPDSGWDRLESLSKLNLSYAGFCSGGLPPSLGNLSQLVSLDLSSNNFSGPVPFFLPVLGLNGLPVSDTNICLNGKLCNLEKLDLSNNSFTGPIHTSVFTLPALRILLLQRNQFSGQLGEFSHCRHTLISVTITYRGKFQGLYLVYLDSYSFHLLQTLSVELWSWNSSRISRISRTWTYQTMNFL